MLLSIYYGTVLKKDEGIAPFELILAINCGVFTWKGSTHRVQLWNFSVKNIAHPVMRYGRIKRNTYGRGT